MPIPALLVGLASTLIDVFTPLARDKVRKEMARHGIDSEAADQINTAVITAAKTVTGISNPVLAVATAQQDPAAIEKVQDDALDTLERMAPLLDKLAAWDEKARAADEASMDAASARAHGESTDMARPLLYGAFAVVGALIFLVGAVVAIQIFKSDGQVATEVWAALTGLIGWATAKAGSIYDYRFGTSRSSAAKDIVIGELSRRPKGQ